MIHLLWPTIRPKMMVETYSTWVSRADNYDNITTYIAVNTSQQQARLKQLFNQRGLHKQISVLVSGDIIGVTHACNYLTQLPQLDGPDTDMVILASDDMYAPQHWDSWLISQLGSRTTNAILVNDGYVKQNNITIPIMTMGCLKKLNRIIYHPSYKHSYSDTELYANLLQLDLLLDLWCESPVFEHKNWANSKRKFDHVDKNISDMVSRDADNWRHRQQMKVQDRLK